MNVELLYWHWLLLGIVLIIAEIFVPSFTILWFGLGAIVVGLTTLAVEMSFTGQIVLWAAASSAFTVLWFKYFKPKMVDRTTAGIAREAAIGESGQVIKAPVDGGRGVVRFTTPILGDDEWEFISEHSVEIGDRVHIKEFSGNTLIVVKLS